MDELIRELMEEFCPVQYRKKYLGLFSDDL